MYKLNSMRRGKRSKVKGIRSTTMISGCTPDCRFGHGEKHDRLLLVLTTRDAEKLPKLRPLMSDILSI
jgi:hypothetical protein